MFHFCIEMSKNGINMFPISRLPRLPWAGCALCRCVTWWWVMWIIYPYLLTNWWGVQGQEEFCLQGEETSFVGAEDFLFFPTFTCRQPIKPTEGQRDPKSSVACFNHIFSQNVFMLLVCVAWGVWCVYLLNNSQLGVYRRLCGLRAPITQDKYCDTHTHTHTHTHKRFLSLSAIPGLTVYLDTVDSGNGMYQMWTSVDTHTHTHTHTHIYVTYGDPSLASLVAYLHLFPSLLGYWQMNTHTHTHTHTRRGQWSERTGRNSLL